MFNLSVETRRLPATPKSRLTEREIIILGHIATLILIIQKEDKRNNTAKELKKVLEQVRRTGVAFHDEEAWEGAEAVAAVIRDERGKATDAMAIGIPKVRMSKAKREKLSTLIKRAAGLISHRLGYHDLKNPISDLQEIRNWWEQNNS